MPNPEELARQNIDKQLSACGWAIQDMTGLNRYASLGVAVRAFPVTGGEADYLLFVDGKAVGWWKPSRKAQISPGLVVL